MIDVSSIVKRSYKLVPAGRGDQLGKLMNLWSNVGYLPIIGQADLDIIVKFLKDNFFCSADWQKLGLQLGLYQPTLKEIDAAKRGDPDDCLRVCLSYWLQKKDKAATTNGGPSLHSLEKALRALGEHAIADKL